MPRALVITVGTGRNRSDIAEAIARQSILRLNPNHVLFMCSPKSAKETVPLIREALKDDFDGELVAPFVAHEENDIDRLFKAYKDEIVRFMKRFRLSPDKITADFTSGTKPMSSALVLAAVTLGLDQLNYIAGERDEGGRTIPGTERIHPLSPRRIYLDARLRDFKNFFDRSQYAAALQILNDVRDRRLDATIREKIDAFLYLTTFYMSWDRYDLDAAVKAKSSLEKLSPCNLLPRPIYASYKGHRDLPGRIEAHPFDWMRLADLFENADRRFRQKQFNDAMARLYRAVEFLAQARLYHEHGIETGNVDLSRVPEDYHEQLAPYKNQKTEKIQIPMIRAYDLLAKLGDGLGLYFQRLYNDNNEQLQKLLNRRNESILAHGFSSVAEDHVSQMMVYLVHLASIAGRNLEKDREQVRFPTFAGSATNSPPAS
ncbi:TIGR02710 family CRISPR-associated CARF protein [Rhodocaloribacter sp.]